MTPTGPSPAPTPPVGLATSFRSVPDLWHHRVGSTPDAEAMRYRSQDQWRTMTWAEAGARVRALANALLALGLEPEQRCVVLAETAVEWILADLAILCAGAATTTVYPRSSDGELEYIVADSGAVVVFTDTPQLQRLRRLRARLPSVERVVALQGLDSEGPSDGWIVGLEEFERQGRDFGASQPEAYTEAHRSIQPEQMATLMYTSGTTGPPKGVVLTHDAWIYETEAIDALGFMNPADVQFLWLPLSHVFAKVLQLSFIRLGMPTVVDGSSDDLVANLAATRPTLMAAVPRTFEKARNGIEAGVRREGRRASALYRWALGVGDRASRAQREGGRLGLRLRLQWALADRWVLAGIRERFGGRLRFLISGGAPLSSEVAEYFHAIGLLILEGYGLTESSAASCVNRIDAFRFGTVGQPLPGCEVRIAEDGEVLLKSRGVMRGYWRQPEATAAVLTEEGFLRTGDLGQLLPSGHLKITGRKKEIIVTAGGKNIAPINFEQRLRARCPYVEHVVMHGDARPFCSALITLDVAEIKRWARKHGLSIDDFETLAEHPQIRDLIQGYVDAVNRELPSFEQVHRFATLREHFTEANGLLTPSHKVRRSAVEARYSAILDGFYGQPERLFSLN